MKQFLVGYQTNIHLFITLLIKQANIHREKIIRIGIRNLN